MKRSSTTGGDIRSFFGNKRSCTEPERKFKLPTGTIFNELSVTDPALSQTTEYDQSESEPSTSEQSSTHSAIVRIQPRPQPQSSSPDLFSPERTVATWLVSRDIGDLISPAKTAAEISHDLKGLSSSDKYSLLYNHANPPNALPSTYSHGCNRKFNTTWLEKYPWLRYSPRLDGVFCGPCALLVIDSKRSDRSCLINKSFSNWVKLGDTLSKHSKLSYHQDSVAKADSLKSTVENPSSRVDVMTNRVVQQQMKDNNHLLRQIVRAILFLARQGLALRGDKEYNTDSKTNQGNFLALLKLFSENDPLLHSHLHSPRAKNATYLSPKIQNEVINIIGNDIIRADLVDEIKKAVFYSVMADEVSSHNIEHLALCVRFVDENCDIREEFVSFVKLDRVRAEDITSSIISTVEGLGLSLNELRGQGYDGASSMSGEKSGVQKRIRDIQPKALYTHCAGHSFNLAIVNSCSVPSVRNCIDVIKNLTRWIKHSPKREGLLKAVYQKGVQAGTNQSRNPILNVCVTRWVENIDGWERFCLSHPFLVHMCEVIVYGDPEFELYNDNWTAEDKRNAMAHLKALENFEFLYTLVTLQRCLMYLREAVVKLQGESQDILCGVTLLEQCSLNLKEMRENIDQFSKRIFEHSSNLATKSGISITQPRISQRQQHRLNVESTSPEEYFKLTIVIPFLDHLLADLSSRFNPHVKQASHLQSLLPSRITSTTSVSDISEAVKFYNDDLPNPMIIDEEMHVWKTKWLSVEAQERPKSLQDCLKVCSKTTLPNIFCLLKLFSTLPVSSCSCERSASTLRRLNNYLRCTQSEERLTSLALIHCNYSKEINVDEICQRFLSKHPRRMQSASILFD